MTPDPANCRVILGLSGGVDSAVAAVRLIEAGADVHALHMTNWEDEDGYCTAAEDLQDARNVCEQIGIPLHHVNFAKQYRDRVFQYFLDEYAAGRTPNPDVLCNREIKFGVFREHAKRLGGELLATGHYARTLVIDRHTRLLKAADLNKDQSYFLYVLTQSQLPRVLMPIGMAAILGGTLTMVGTSPLIMLNDLQADLFARELAGQAVRQAVFVLLGLGALLLAARGAFLLPSAVLAVDLQQQPDIRVFDGDREVSSGDAVDLGSVRDALLRVSRLVADFRRIVEFDVNPFIAHEERDRCCAVDVRFRLGPAE